MNILMVKNLTNSVPELNPDIGVARIFALWVHSCIRVVILEFGAITRIEFKEGDKPYPQENVNFLVWK